MTRDQACIVIDYLEALEERVNHNSIMEKLEEDGFTETEIDQALKGTIAGRSCGIL